MNCTEHESGTRIPIRGALKTLATARSQNALVITNQGTSRVWPLIAEHPLDFHFNPSTMGGSVPFGVGVALAQPDREVIALTGDGSLLMSLGSLVTVVAAGCANLTIILTDNNIYDVTGGQKTAASSLSVDYAMLAKSVGFETVATFDDSASWDAGVEEFLQAPGPRLAWLRVDPALPDDMKTVQEPMADQLTRIRQAM
ncbi:MAG: hypothetical protein CMJ72_15805 [Planctomycetaceae bacterium]|nr:hypothetical protein [Planctomycetaceae bacterium]